MSILADLLNENYINETEGNDTVSTIKVYWTENTVSAIDIVTTTG